MASSRLTCRAPSPRLLRVAGALGVALMALVGCSDRDLRGADTASTAPDSTSAAARPADGDATVRRIDHGRVIDLTGDGAADTLRVVAIGPRPDSLAVRLSIVGGDGRLLHVVRWNTRDYFKYDDVGALSADTVDARVRRALGRLVSDSAFIRPTAVDHRGRSIDIDTAAVAHDLREAAWRADHRVADTTAVPPAAQTVLASGAYDDAGTPQAVAALVAEVRGRPTLSYYIGGEETYTVAWSPSRGRFVRIWACC